MINVMNVANSIPRNKSCEEYYLSCNIIHTHGEIQMSSLISSEKLFWTIYISGGSRK